MLKQIFMDGTVGKTIKEICHMGEFIVIVFEDSFIYIKPYINEDGYIGLGEAEFHIDKISSIRHVQELCELGILTQDEVDEEIRRRKLGYSIDDIAVFKKAVGIIGWEKAREILGEM